MDRRSPTAIDQFDGLATVVDLVRSGRARTRPELSSITMLGRTLISQRLEQAMGLGLLEYGETGPSSGGRAPRLLRFRSGSGLVLCATLGVSAMDVAVLDLGAEVLAHRHVEWPVSAGPQATLERIGAEFDSLLAGFDPTAVWGIAVSVPGPVEFSTGRSSHPPIMPGWNGFDIRTPLQNRYEVPVWVDNDVNLMALGELRSVPASAPSMIFLKVSTGVGAGIIVDGRVHRGAQGGAGDIGHAHVADSPAPVCRCGRTGCLEAVASGWSLVRDALTAVHEGRSRYLAALHAEQGELSPADIGRGVLQGDSWCSTAVAQAAGRVGDLMAVLVNFFNPHEIVLGGGVLTVGDMFANIIQQTVQSRSLTLATQKLRVRPAELGDLGGVMGGAHLVADALLSPDALAVWAAAGSPRKVAPDILSSYA
ncbi:ROK family protein [Streptomyces sp. NBC_00059]|uniref:ROK family protein n=1 Tax=Streptomyces sp. NBC_00059 TaxID=2975635 RepID=UPI0022534B39|nr:ROK family protein [Streptomyces sp. NBC_00059]MCX5412735.1 ROK family protein [Streptomyces sp. NBC_00059]